MEEKQNLIDIDAFVHQYISSYSLCYSQQLLMTVKVGYQRYEPSQNI